MSQSPSSFETPDPYRTPSSAPQKSGEMVPYTSEEKNWAMAAHLVPLSNFVVPVPGFNIIAPAIVWFLKRETMPMVDDQGKEAINFQITLTLASLVCFALMFIMIGFVLLFALLIYGIVMEVLAAKAVQEGRLYRYPYSLRLL